MLPDPIFILGMPIYLFGAFAALSIFFGYKIAENEMVSVFYESTHRILKTLEKMKNFLEPQRQIVVSRELTKKFETIYRGNISQVLEQVKKDTIKGEFVVIISGK